MGLLPALLVLVVQGQLESLQFCVKAPLCLSNLVAWLFSHPCLAAHFAFRMKQNLATSLTPSLLPYIASIIFPLGFLSCRLAHPPASTWPFCPFST